MRRAGRIVNEVVRDVQDRGVTAASAEAPPSPKPPAAVHRTLLEKWKLLGLIAADPKMTGRGPSAAAWQILDCYDRRRRVHEISIEKIAKRSRMSPRNAGYAVEKLVSAEYFFVISGGLKPDGLPVSNRYRPNWGLLEEG